MDNKVFEEQLKEWDVPFAVIADLKTGHTNRVGSSMGFDFDDLENTLFRDSETVFATGHCLDGHILPRIWSQGKVSCFLYKPSEQTVVGLFCCDERNAIEKYQWSKQLTAVITEAFACA